MDLIGWKGALNALVGGGTVLGLQALGRLVITDVATRISASVWGIKTFNKVTGWIMHHGIWSGRWQVTWQVDSPNFAPVNTETGRLYRCLSEAWRSKARAPHRTGVRSPMLSLVG